MKVLKYEEEYQQILNKLADAKLDIALENVYNFCKANGLMNLYPFPEDEYLYERVSKYSDDEYAKMTTKSEEKVKKAKAAKEDVADSNIFKLNYTEKKNGGIKIPIVEIIKDYFLTYQTNINNIRRGKTDAIEVAKLQIYEHLLYLMRNKMLASLGYAISADPNKWTNDDFYYHDISKETVKIAVKQTEQAQGVLQILKDTELQASDYKNSEGEASYQPAVNDIKRVSKQMFVDIISSKYPDNPIVKKAVSQYVEAQNDETLMAKMETLFNQYAKDRKRVKNNGDSLEQYLPKVYDYKTFISQY